MMDRHLPRGPEAPGASNASDASDASALLAELVRDGVLASLDRRFGELLARLDPSAPTASVLAGAVAFAARARGHVCLSLGDGSQRALLAADPLVRARLDASLDAARATLPTSTFVRHPADVRDTPLVFDGERLYLDRMHRAESVVACGVEARLDPPSVLDAARGARIASDLRRLFGVGETDPFSDQMRAVLLASRARFAIVSGGPGTGKTTTVVRILALLLEQEPDLRIRLLAPTGKAAARLSDSIRAQLASLDSPVREAIPTDASTLHRALGMRPDRPSKPRFGAESRLPSDVVVVDEASMVDVELMAALFEALEPQARLILLGDRDQLASVEAGSVLDDLAGPKDAGVRVSPSFARSVATVHTFPEGRVAETELPAIADCIARLEGSRRFDPSRGIGQLASAVRVGDVDASYEAFRHSEAEFLRTSDEAAVAGIVRQVAALHARIAETGGPEEALASLETIRVLCALRRGQDGVEGWNERILEALVRQRAAPRGRLHYHGRPVLVTQNDPDAQLYNGDVGIELVVQGTLRVCFPDPRPEVRYRMMSPARLPAHETVYAMTIHKSQGSEVDHVVLVLPREESRVLGRELVYTGITRARKRVSILGERPGFERALRTTVARGSGLRERLWGRPS